MNWSKVFVQMVVMAVAVMFRQDNYSARLQQSPTYSALMKAERDVSTHLHSGLRSHLIPAQDKLIRFNAHHRRCC